MPNPSSNIAIQRLTEEIQRLLAEQYRIAFSEAVKRGIAKSKAKRMHLRPAL